MKALCCTLLTLFCLILFTENGANGQLRISLKEAMMQSTPDGPSLGALKRHSPSPVQRVAVLSDSALPPGMYTVGQGGWFPTLDSAFKKLQNDGMLGPVTLTLIDTLYRAQPGRRFELGQVAGAGPNAGVTIRPAVNTRVTIVGDSNAVLTFTNVKYLTLDGRSNPPAPSAGITVHALYKPASAWNDCIEAWGDADYNQFLYLTIRSDDFRNVSPGGAACITLGGSGTALMPDSNLVEGNLMSGVFGVYVSAWITSPSIRPRGNIIRGNTYGLITDLHGAWGIQSEVCEGTLIEGNTVQFMRGSFQTTNNGRIWSIGINAYGDLNSTIRNNVVHAVYTSNAAELYGILGSGTTGTVGTGLLIYNNMVYDLQNTSTTGNACIEGINLWSNVNNQILYNTVYLSGAGANPVGVDALCLWTTVTNTTLRNNIFVNFYQQTASPSTAVWANGVFTSDYNDLAIDTSFANSYTVHLSSFYRTLSNWQGAGYDPHSLSVLPVFRTPHVHLDSTSTISRQLDNAGVPVTGITTDFDGQLRDSTPVIGADECDFVVGVEEERTALPQRFLLEQNYPNPFNPSTTIHYGLPHNSFVTLAVYNTLGQQVAQLVNEQQQAGYHNVMFRGDRLASAVYFYRLEAGSFVSVKKLLLLR